MAGEFPKINLNTASEHELTKIPSIDEPEARKIIQYREEHGGFKTVEELHKIVAMPGFGVEGIRKYVTVGDRD